MSNIVTDFVRLYAWAGHRIDRAEAEWIGERLLSARGSYWVPVTIHLAPDLSHVDLQYGSGKGTGMVEFWDDYGDQYDAVWTRSFDPAHPYDLIWRGGPNTGHRTARLCEYASDEAGVTGPAGEPTRRSKTPGPDLTCTSRPDINTAPRLGGIDWNAPRAGMRAGGLPTPTTPCYDDVSMRVLEPAELTVFTTDDRPAVARRVEFFWRGRLVHRAQEEYDDFLGRRTWQHRSADGWDNCADPAFLSYSRSRSRTAG